MDIFTITNSSFYFLGSNNNYISATKIVKLTTIGANLDFDAVKIGVQ